MHGLLLLFYCLKYIITIIVRQFKAVSILLYICLLTFCSEVWHTFRGGPRFVTVCDREEGGVKIIKNSVTYFMDGPQHRDVIMPFLNIPWTIILHKFSVSSRELRGSPPPNKIKSQTPAQQCCVQSVNKICPPPNFKSPKSRCLNESLHKLHRLNCSLNFNLTYSFFLWMWCKLNIFDLNLLLATCRLPHLIFNTSVTVAFSGR